MVMLGTAPLIDHCKGIPINGKPLGLVLLLLALKAIAHHRPLEIHAIDFLLWVTWRLMVVHT
jgi:hypothetical protein